MSRPPSSVPDFGFIPQETAASPEIPMIIQP